MNILVNGSSFSRGERSWPTLLQQELGCNLVNLSVAGSGNTYIQETTIAELAQRQYNKVIIMWSPFDRIDVKVKDIDTFKTTYTSKYQVTLNDWPNKVLHPVNDQDYVEKDWVFGCGYLNKDTDPALVDLFAGYYNHTDRWQQFYSNLIRVISLQGFLKSIDQPYLFTFARQFRQFTRYEHLYSLLDWDNIYETDLQAIVRENNWFEADGIHPDNRAHEYYVKEILKIL
jgi:virulence-associated protein VapD